MDTSLYLKKYNQFIKDYEKLSLYLTYPEVFSDKMYYKALFLRRAKIDKIYRLLMQIKENESDLMLIKELQNKVDIEISRLNDDGIVGCVLQLVGDENIVALLKKEYILRGKRMLFDVDEESLSILGSGAYSYFVNEIGLHRFDGCPSGLAKVYVYKYEKENIYDEADIEIMFLHSDGAGGQNVNKVESGVRVVHKPTNIVVVCKDERSQLQNKEKALARIKERVETKYKEDAKKVLESERKRQDKNLKEIKYINGKKI